MLKKYLTKKHAITVVSLLLAASSASVVTWAARKPVKSEEILNERFVEALEEN